MDAGTLNRSRLGFWLCAIFAALTRWPALSRTLWDWDEALFAIALSDYNVAAYHPHPPGFPLFIGFAKLIPLDAFHALQALVFASSLFVFPAMWFLARELGADDATAIGAGLLLSFFPNVWFYGGTALSDVPSMVLAITASALLLRGRRDTRALIAGAILLGIAAGFRPQNLLIGFVPFVAAFLQKKRAAVIGGLLIAIIVVATYGTVAHLSGGWSDYRDAVQRHQSYIRNTDSFLAPFHPGLIKVADDFFFWPYRAPLINIAITLLVAHAVLRRRRWLVIAIFGPFCLFAWLFLDFHSASRFSVAYMPLFAMLAAEGIPRRARVPVLAGLVAAMIVWTWPALRVVHTTSSPPVAAIESLRGTDKTIYVDDRLAPHAELLLPRFTLVRFAPPLVDDPNAVLLREGVSAANAHVYKRERDRLAAIARDRYFEVSVVFGRRPANQGLN